MTLKETMFLIGALIQLGGCVFVAYDSMNDLIDEFRSFDIWSPQSNRKPFSGKRTLFRWAILILVLMLGQALKIL